MEFKELKCRLIKARDLVIKRLDFYNNTIFHINKENYLFRCTLNRMAVPEFELIKPNLDYFKIHPYYGPDDVKFEFIVHPWDHEKDSKPSKHEEVKTLERFCEILGWDENNVNEFNTYLDMFNVKRI